MSNKVISAAYGRLGNILFEIGAGLTYAKRYNKEFHLINKDPAITPFKNYPWFYSKFKEENEKMFNREVYMVWREDQTKPPKEIPYTEGNIILDGYFQSELYMDKDLVRSAFRIDDSDRDKFIKKYDGVEDGVGISIRRGDYLNLKHIFNVLNSFYYEDIYEKYFNGMKCFITSDDMNWCKENLKIKNVDYIEETDENTLRVLSLCKHHILSCSTFSWWGSWLEEKEDSINIVPSNWFNKNCNLDGNHTVPDRWKKVELKEEYLEK